MSVQSSRSTGVTKTNHTQTPKEAWLIVGLLFLFMLINFADKAVIGIAAVPIMQELKLGPRQFGLLGSSFSCCFPCRRSSPASSSIEYRRAGRCWSWDWSGR
jgi:MFS transporter, ACS family, D-galactonate transporter